MTPPILSAGSRDRTRVAAMLARAFDGDPAFTYLFPNPEKRARALPTLFGLLFDSDGRAGMRLVHAGGAAATLWRGPGRAETGWIEMLRHAVPLLAAVGGALPRALRLADAIEAHFPAGPFWYLHVAGCDPAQQGRGLGGEVVRAGLARIAGQGLPAYLETATERNLGFYQSLGFVVTAAWQPANGGPRFWSMLRR
jgi:ribosomal protein S18 acetylase RimI-like enzyme